MPTMTDPALVRLDVADAVATVTLDSPANRNALSTSLVTSMMQHLNTLTGRTDVRAVVIAAAGPVFCAGADMREAATEGMEAGARALVALQRLILSLDQPVAARVHGPVRAGGLGILGACDVVISTDAVTFAFTEVLLGLAPAVISLTTLPRLTSRGASETYLSGAGFDAHEAVRIGLVTRAVPAEQLDEAVAEVTSQWAGTSAQGLRETKALLNDSVLRRIDDLGEQVARQSAQLFASEEARAAMQAFLSRTR